MNFSRSAVASPRVSVRNAEPLPKAPWTKKTTAGLSMPAGTWRTQLRVWPETFRLRVTFVWADTDAASDAAIVAAMNPLRCIELLFRG